MIAYLHDPDAFRQRHAEGGNAWDVYLREILGLIGIRGLPLAPTDLTAGRLASVDALLIGSVAGQSLSAAARETLSGWVRNGGLLIGFQTPGLDDLFGIRQGEPLAQRPDDYAIAGYVQLCPHRLTCGLHPLAQPDQKLPVLSGLFPVALDGAAELGRLYRENGNGSYTGQAAITWNRWGGGFAGYFAFDAAKTCWLLHQGRPRPTLGKNGALLVNGDNSRTIPFADELAFLIQNMLAEKPFPFFYQIPPDEGRVADALFYWSGDEYSGPVELSLFASDWMKEQGLPYHINIESDRHPMTRGEFEHIRANGHEVSVYWHLKSTPGLAPDLKSMEFKLSPTETLDLLGPLLKEQSDRFFERFGIRPGATLFERTMWIGGTELPRLMKAAGATADNTRTGCMAAGFNQPYDDPFYNGPGYGFACGTAYPFFYYDDATRGNARIDFIEQPIVWYELGHRASLVGPFRDGELGCSEDVHVPIDTAIRNHQVINVFYHPAYIRKSPRCREAIREIVRYIRDRKYRVLHLGANRCADWWYARDASAVRDVVRNETGLGFTAETGWEDGAVVKIPLNGSEAESVSGNGKPLHHRVKREFGRDWLYAVLPSGTTRVHVSIKTKGLE